MESRGLTVPLANHRFQYPRRYRRVESLLSLRCMVKCLRQ